MLVQNVTLSFWNRNNKPLSVLCVHHVDQGLCSSRMVLLEGMGHVGLPKPYLNVVQHNLVRNLVQMNG